MEPLLAGLPACVRLRLHGVKVSESQGPLMLTLDGPQRLCGQVSLHGAGRIEARFTVRKAGQYALKVCESETGRALLRDLLDVLAGVAHTASTVVVRGPSSSEPRVLLLQAVDAHGNAHARGGARFAAALTAAPGDPEQRCGIVDTKDGRYRVELPLAAAAGPRTLRLWQPELKSESELRLPVLLPRLPPCACAVARARAPTAAEPLEFALTLLDGVGLPRPTAPASLRVTLDGEPVTVRLPVPPADAASPAAAAPQPLLQGQAAPSTPGSSAEFVRAPSATQLQPPLRSPAAARPPPALPPPAVVAGLDKSPSHRAAPPRAPVAAGSQPGGEASASASAASLAQRVEHACYACTASCRAAGTSELVVMYCAAAGAPWVLLHREVIEFRLCPSPPMPPPVPEASPPPHRAAPPPPPPPPPAPLPKRPPAKPPLPPLDARQCDVIGLQLKATLGQRASFTILARDAFGRECPCARSSPFRISLLHAPGYITSSVQRDATDGTCRYVVTYVPHGCAGVYLLAVTYAARPVRGSPFRVVVSPAGRTLGARPATAPGRMRGAAAPAVEPGAPAGRPRTARGALAGVACGTRVVAGGSATASSKRLPHRPATTTPGAQHVAGRAGTKMRRSSHRRIAVAWA